MQQNTTHKVQTHAQHRELRVRLKFSEAAQQVRHIWSIWMWYTLAIHHVLCRTHAGLKISLTRPRWDG